MYVRDSTQGKLELRAQPLMQMAVGEFLEHGAYGAHL